MRGSIKYLNIQIQNSSFALENFSRFSIRNEIDTVFVRKINMERDVRYVYAKKNLADLSKQASFNLPG